MPVSRVVDDQRTRLGLVHRLDLVRTYFWAESATNRSTVAGRRPSPLCGSVTVSPLKKSSLASFLRHPGCSRSLSIRGAGASAAAIRRGGVPLSHAGLDHESRLRHPHESGDELAELVLGRHPVPRVPRGSVDASANALFVQVRPRPGQASTVTWRSLRTCASFSMHRTLAARRCDHHVYSRAAPERTPAARSARSSPVNTSSRRSPFMAAVPPELVRARRRGVHGCAVRRPPLGVGLSWVRRGYGMGTGPDPE